MQGENFLKVHNYIEKVIPLLEHPPSKAIPYPYPGVSQSQYYQNCAGYWDAHWSCMRFAYAGKPEYFKFNIDNLLAYQTSDGFTPCGLLVSDGPVHYFPKFHAQPFLMQGALIYLLRTGDQQWARERFGKLKSYLAYYENNFSAPYGLFRWPVSWMSGMDNDVVTTFFQPDTVISADINAWLFLEYRAAAKVALETGLENEHAQFTERAQKLKTAVNQVLWYEKENSYASFDLCLNRNRFSYEHSGPEEGLIGRYSFQSCSNLIPLYARMADEKKAGRMIENYVLNDKHFLSAYGIRSLSKSSEYYNNAIWGNPPRFGSHRRLTNSNWQGPIWTLLSYLMFHALVYYGFSKEARNLAERTINVLAMSLDKIGSFTENFHGDTGEPLYAPGYGSWNLLADAMDEETKKGRWLMEPVFKEDEG